MNPKFIIKHGRSSFDAETLEEAKQLALRLVGRCSPLPATVRPIIDEEAGEWVTGPVCFEVAPGMGVADDE